MQSSTSRRGANPSAAGTYLSEGSFGWSDAFGTHFWVDPKEKLVAVLMTQTALPGRNVDFETAVMQAVVGGATGTATR
jgi:CubicO group peptidase (beta-lactamase class C family)